MTLPDGFPAGAVIRCTWSLWPVACPQGTPRTGSRRSASSSLRSWRTFWGRSLGGCRWTRSLWCRRNSRKCGSFANEGWSPRWHAPVARRKIKVKSWHWHNSILLAFTIMDQIKKRCAFYTKSQKMLDSCLWRCPGTFVPLIAVLRVSWSSVSSTPGKVEGPWRALCHLKKLLSWPAKLVNNYRPI